MSTFVPLKVGETLPTTILSHFQWKSPHLINSSVRLSVTMFDQIFLYQLLRLFCFVVSFQTPILENGMVRMGIFVANGKRFCTKGRRPLVFRMPIRNVPFSIRYICVSKKHEGRNLTFVPRAEGPWFVGAGRRLFVFRTRR